VHVTPDLREFLFRYDGHAPLAIETVQTEAGQNLVRERLTFASVNQVRVPAIFTYDPTTPAPRPALIIQHGLHSSKDDPRLAELTAAWIPYGFAVLTIDAPLHGERAVGELDLMNLLGQPYTGLRFVVQNVVDLRRAVDLLHQRPDVAGDRLAYVGFSMSTFLGVQFVALEPRVRAACLALGGAGLFHFFSSQAADGARDDLETVASLVDPLHYAGLIAPRPVLQVNSDTDQIVPAALGHMLYGALQEPKRAIWFQGEHGEVPDDVLREMRLFLSDALDVG
jgi:cephalosporin-C deacetylase-like acetyl esterase